MKIIHTIPYFLPSKAFGGPIIAVHEIAKAQVKRDHEVQIFTTNVIDQNNFPSKFIEEEFIDGIQIKRFKVYGKFMSYFFTPQMITSLRKENFDIIHAHGYRNFQTDTAALVSSLKKKPLTINLHGMFAKNVALERGFERGQKIYNIYDSITRTFSLRTAKVLIANSKFEYDSIPKFKDKTHIVPFGIDFKKYQDRKKGQFRRRYNIKDETIILYVGRISRGKNIETLIKAFKAVSMKHDVKLIIAGEELPSVHIEKNYRDTLIELARNYGVDNNVVFTGGLYEDDLLNAYADADVFVNPSSAENFGLVNLEAAAGSLPVVAAPVGVAPDLVKEHRWLLFQSEEELADILNRLLEDETLRLKIGEMLRRTVEKEYHWEKAAERIEEIYEMLIK